MFFKALFFMKLNMNAVAATTSMITYCMIVTLDEAQNESAGVREGKVTLEHIYSVLLEWEDC